jgi:hypothetical protein
VLEDQPVDAGANSRPRVRAAICDHSSRGPQLKRRRTATAAATRASMAWASGSPRSVVGNASGVEGDDGLDADVPQMLGRAPGPAQPAAHGVFRGAELGSDLPVAVPAYRADQGLAQEAHRVRAMRQQASVEHDVRAAAGGAPGSVRPHREQAATEVTDGSGPGLAPGLQRGAAVRAAQHPSAQGPGPPPRP